MLTVEVRVTGPIVEGRGPAVVDDMLRDARTDLAATGLHEVMDHLAASIRHRTPYYETRLNIESGPNVEIVNDDRVIYGRWLEGVGSRNYPKTRFRGYRAFGRAYGIVAARAQAVLQWMVDRHIHRLR